MSTNIKERVIQLKIRDYMNNQLTLDEVLEQYKTLSIEEELARKIAILRKDNNLTQKQLSEMTGIDQADISKIESGHRSVSIRILKKIADSLDMKIIIEFEPKE